MIVSSFNVVEEEVVDDLDTALDIFEKYQELFCEEEYEVRLFKMLTNFKVFVNLKEIV